MCTTYTIRPIVIPTARSIIASTRTASTGAPINKARFGACRGVNDDGLDVRLIVVEDSWVLEMVTDFVIESDELDNCKEASRV